MNNIMNSAMNKKTHKQIAILGGGLVGRLLAWRLAVSYQHQDNGIKNTITVFEKGRLAPDQNNTEKAAAFTAAAMISPTSEVVSSELAIYQLGQKSLALWPSWLAQLNCTQHFHQQGSLVVAHPSDLAELEQFKRDLRFKLNEQQWSGHNAPQELPDRSALEALEPDISQHFQTGLYLPSEAHIDHDEVLPELVTQAAQLGVIFKQNCAIEPDDESLSDYDLIFDCRGMGLKAAYCKTSPTKPSDFRGVRGEVIRIECKEVTLKRPIRIMHPRYKLYIVPKPNHQFIIGATEIESEDRSPISLRSAMELLSALYAVNPAFAEARILRQETNLRPAYMDHLPRIESLLSQHQKPIIRINGLYRHGYLIGPALVEQAVAQTLKNIDQ